MISCRSGIQTSTLMLISGKNYSNIISISLGNQDFPKQLWWFPCLFSSNFWLSENKKNVSACYIYIYYWCIFRWRKSIDDSLNWAEKIHPSILAVHQRQHLEKIERELPRLGNKRVQITLPIKLTTNISPWKSAKSQKGKDRIPSIFRCENGGLFQGG